MAKVAVEVAEVTRESVRTPDVFQRPVSVKVGFIAGDISLKQRFLV